MGKGWKKKGKGIGIPPREIPSNFSAVVAPMHAGVETLGYLHGRQPRRRQEAESTERWPFSNLQQQPQQIAAVRTKRIA